MRSGPGRAVITGHSGRWYVRTHDWKLYGPYRFRISARLMLWCVSDD